MAVVPSQFRLQSDDDIHDAPIETAEYQLLQTANTTVKRFYRRRLGLEIHGRVAVLKDTLRQIGQPDRDSPRMLRYLARYYSQTLTELDQSGDANDQADARELQTLMSSARTVPCLDGDWMAAHPCSEAWQMGNHLASQGWPKKGLTSLLLHLLWGKHIASIDPEIRKLLLSLHNLPGLDSRKIVELAITSECPEFKLADRVKLFWANKRDFPERGVERSKAAGQLQVPALAGPVTLAEAEFFGSSRELTHLTRSESSASGPRTPLRRGFQSVISARCANPRYFMPLGNNRRTSDIGPGTKTMIAKDTRKTSIGTSRFRSMNTNTWTRFWWPLNRLPRREV